MGDVCVTAYPPPPVGIEDTRKEVHDGIDIGGEVVAGEPDVLSRVDDDRDLLFLQQFQHAAEEFGRAGAAREEGNHEYLACQGYLYEFCQSGPAPDPLSLTKLRGV